MERPRLSRGGPDSAKAADGPPTALAESFVRDQGTTVTAGTHPLARTRGSTKRGREEGRTRSARPREYRSPDLQAGRRADVGPAGSATQVIIDDRALDTWAIEIAGGHPGGDNGNATDPHLLLQAGRFEMQRIAGLGKEELMRLSLGYACGCTFTLQLEPWCHSPEGELHACHAHGHPVGEAGHQARRPLSVTYSTEGGG
ncbi:MAG TPA: hypothetical protein VLG48_05860 [Candidatus Methylomirabilis sp.]|nr:hypothetical protein [Candidatus Methylomirabilis sp.]